MNVLLTGATGFLGNIIKSEFESKYTIYTIGRNKQLNSIWCDLSTQVPDLSSYSIDSVVHVAGKAHIVPKTETEKQDFYTVNFQGTKNLLEGIDKLLVKPTSFVFISSVAVYGLSIGKNINEDTPLNAKDPYGHSKILCENYITDWGKKNKVSTTILRLPLLAGRNPPGNLQAMIKGIKKGYYFNIKHNHAKKSIVLAEDVAKLICTSGLKGGIYNLTDTYHPDFIEISNTIEVQFHKKKSIELPFWFIKGLAIVGNIFGRDAFINTYKLEKIVSTLTFDDRKARKELDWNPRSVIDNFKID